MTTKERVKSYNRLSEPCADCRAKPNTEHKSTCKGGCHSLETEGEHTPLRVDNSQRPNRGRVFIVDNKDRLSIAVLYGKFEQREAVSIEEAQQRAAFIVRAVNSHERLVQVAKMVNQFLATLPPTYLETEKQNRTAFRLAAREALVLATG